MKASWTTPLKDPAPSVFRVALSWAASAGGIRHRRRGAERPHAPGGSRAAAGRAEGGGQLLPGPGRRRFRGQGRAAESGTDHQARGDGERHHQEGQEQHRDDRARAFRAPEPCPHGSLLRFMLLLVL